MDAQQRQEILARGLEILQALPDRSRAAQAIGARLKGEFPGIYPSSQDARRLLLREILGQGGELPPPGRMEPTMEPTMEPSPPKPPRSRVETVQAAAAAYRSAPRQQQTRKADRWPQQPGRPDYGRRVRATVLVGKGLMEAVRDAVAALDGATLAELVEDGLGAHLARLEAEHNDGQPFPRRQGGLRRGPRA